MQVPNGNRFRVAAKDLLCVHSPKYEVPPNPVRRALFRRLLRRHSECRAEHSAAIPEQGFQSLYGRSGGPNERGLRDRWALPFVRSHTTTLFGQTLLQPPPAVAKKRAREPFAVPGPYALVELQRYLPSRTPPTLRRESLLVHGGSFTACLLLIGLFLIHCRGL